MAQALQHKYPYQEVIRDILALGHRPAGWNSYRAPKIAEQVQLRAIELVARFDDLGSASVPPPDVGASPVGGVVLRWLTDEGEVEIHFTTSGGEYSVTRKDGQVIEGDLGHLDPLKDIVNSHVLGRRPLQRPGR